MTDSISHYDDIIDSRQIIDRIAELEENPGGEETDDDEIAELESLQALASDASDYCPDWSYGVALIRDSYFETYAQELADDIGAVDSSASWPMNCIDWERAARELRMDYTSVDFDGVTYWVR